MEDLSLHILDIAENAIRAAARTIEIAVEEDLEQDRLTIVLRDDGAGMDEGTRRRALDPFYTTKERKRVGLGLSLLAEAARSAGGQMTIESEPGRGTRVVAQFRHSHVDRQPLGDLADTIESLIIGNPQVRVVFHHRGPHGERRLDTRTLQERLGAVPIWSGEGIGIVREALRGRGRREEENRDGRGNSE